MTDIQKARDVLAKWRDDSRNVSPGAWSVDPSRSIFPTVRDEVRGEVARELLSEDARLIVGTAGNPELLDAIDGFLADELVESGVCHCGTYLEDHHLKEHGFVDMCIQPNPLADAIAAAIIAADERMTS